MSALAFVAATLLVIVAGAWIARLGAIARLDRRAQLAIMFATGCLVAAAIMFIESLLGMPWDRVSLGSPLFFLALAAPRSEWRQRAAPSPWSWSDTAIVFLVALTLYGALDTRETNGDLVHFWGPKAQQFHLTGKIDADFLGFQHYYLMHPDYPPLLPLVYAWGSLGSHGFSWWGALLLTPLFLYATVEAFRGLARDALGAEDASRVALLLAAVMTYGFAQSRVAGAADPPLLLFETIALAALTFEGDGWGGVAIAALALAAASWTKVEGAAFAIVVVAAFAALRRRPPAVLALLLTPAALLGAWIAFASRHHLLDAYAANRGTLNLASLPAVLFELVKSASYGAFFLPWIAAAVPLLISRRWRTASLPLAVAILSIGYTIFFYVHGSDPRWWIKASGDRVLLTPLMCLVIASAASMRRGGPRGRSASPSAR